MSKSDLIENDELLLGTFQIGDAYYGLDTILVQEVSLVIETTIVHSAPEYVHGIINLRGQIVTVIDVGKKLGLAEAEISDDSRILIVPWQTEQVGLLVDRVDEVLSLQKEQIKPPPANINADLVRYIEGAYQDEGRLVGILNLDAVLAT